MFVYFIMFLPNSALYFSGISATSFNKAWANKLSKWHSCLQCVSNNVHETVCTVDDHSFVASESGSDYCVSLKPE